jgi:hypothetical protein
MKKVFMTIIAAIFVLGLVSIGLAQPVTPPEKPVVQTGTPAPKVVTPEAGKPVEKTAAQTAATPKERTLVSRVFTIIIAGFIGLLGLTILYLIWCNKINLSQLISESDGTASMSRFQLLVFTFVISSGLFIITIQSGDFPEVKESILKLLGISSGSYLGAKVIQSVKDTTMEKNKPTPQNPDQGKAGVKSNPEQEKVA